MDSASSSSSNSNNSNFLSNTTTTSSADTSGSLSPHQKQQQQQQQQLQQQSIQHDTNNETNFIEQLIQQNPHLILNNPNCSKFTLSRNNTNQMFDANLPQSPKAQNKFLTNRFGTLNNAQQQQQQQQLCQYVDLNGAIPNALPPPSMATTAYLVQTPNGSALLIPPQTALNPTHFIQTNSSSLQPTSMNTFSLTRNPYGITSIPIQSSGTNTATTNNNSNTLSNTTTSTTLPNSVSITSPNCFNRPDSTASTNVYQTIDTEKNGYLYPLENYYDSAFNNNNNINTMNNFSTRHKQRRNMQQQQQQFQLAHQQPSQFSKLIENQTAHMNGTLHSNTNNTNSNFFVSPALSASSNRRLANGSFFERFKYRLSKKIKLYCSWKCLAMLFLFITLNLFTFTIYLAIMRMYNLNWHLKEMTPSVATIKEQKRISHVLFYNVGDSIEEQIQPYETFYLQSHLYASKYVKFNLTISRNAHVGIYMDKNAPPTHTKFKFFETFDGNTLISKNIKSEELNKKLSSNHQTFLGASSMVNTAFVHYLDDGLWYINVFNDNKNTLKFKLKTEYYDNVDSNCPMSCYGKGECVSGVCKCFAGFTGIDCSESVCPLVCSGHGKYESGKCECDSNWHGSECEIPIDQCESPNCSGHGECIRGKCVCSAGYEGNSCETLKCVSSNCSNNGVCMRGKCVCFSNFTGDDCSQTQVSPQSICSNHGDFEYTSKTCHCYRGYSGADCSRNENCVDKLCSICKNGWSGPNCLSRVPFQCDIRCADHGICVNGTCNCSPGYQGRNCDINNCPNSCSSNGICERTTNQYSKYHCVCNPGWTGRACDTAIEMVCNDDKDNDNDGLVDCMDPECCAFDSCKLSLACNTSPEPKDRLLRKQPPSLSATFFEKMRFLIEDGSVQSFANSNSFSESQVSVIRGQVVFKNGQPLVGVKVSVVSNPSFGYTLTRNNGIFDIMVNGGGSVQLEFSRNQLKTRIVSVVAVWNQFVYVDPVVLYLTGDADNLIKIHSCKSEMHNSSSVYPTVKTTWKEIRTYYYDNSLILPDSGVVRSELNLIDTNLKLVYSSNQAQGFTSTIFTLLTRREIPDTLQQVHLQIVVEGVLHKQTFDAYPDLRYEYSWDRRNAYEQRVYGLTFAKVMVGYQYEDCAFIYWETSIVKLAGYDLGSSEIGNWNIDVHHRLNTQQGILHKGDGTTIYLKEIQKQIELAAGQLNAKRDLNCDASSSCESSLRFYSPYSLSINKDGVLFIADYNYIWMLNNSESARRVLELKPDQVYKYYIANEPVNGNLFVSDPIKRQLFTSKTFEAIDPKQNLKSVNHFQQVNYPKAFAYDLDGIMYFIDGNKIKSMNNDGLITTIIGNDQEDMSYKPMGCNTSYVLNEMQFYWPLSLTVNPINNNIYILDENAIYRITSYNKVELVAGQPYGCSFETKKLHNPIDMSFNSDGDLFILENDKKKRLKQIRVLKSNGDLETYFSDENIKSSLSETSSSFVGFNDPVAIAVHQNKSVYVLDKGDNALYHIKNSVLKDEYTGKYTIVSPETREAYIFNRFGLHLSTIDLLTGTTMYNFTYNGNALYGKLTSVSDHSRVVLTVKRDFHGRAELLQTTNMFNIKLKLNNFDMLKSLSTNENRTYTFNYMGNTGLLTQRTELSDKVTVFSYEKNGKVKEVIEPNNRITNISYYINSSGIVTLMNRGELNSETWISNGSFTYIYKNNKLETIMESNKMNLNIRALTNEEAFNSYKSYFKSVLNFKAFATSNLIKNDDYNNNNNSGKRKFKNSKKRDLDNVLFIRSN